MITLYLKTHNVTGLKYLGKTIQDPFRYKGSGVYWSDHLKVHGNNVTTEILFQTECADQLEQMGLMYSRMWNIVESKEFANLKEENGDGGQLPKLSVEHKRKISKAHMGKTYSEETIKRMSAAAIQRNKDKPQRGRRCVVEGIIYDNYTQLSNAVGMPKTTCISRIQSKTFGEWNYL